MRLLKALLVRCRYAARHGELQSLHAQIFVALEVLLMQMSSLGGHHFHEIGHHKPPYFDAAAPKIASRKRLRR